MRKDEDYSLVEECVKGVIIYTGCGIAIGGMLIFAAGERIRGKIKKGIEYFVEKYKEGRDERNG
ncbi:hypothetical protein HYW76_04490 [Candidatus Pacearchaeota archaeon]|nr:hypothetical protein [Candidatus Pacearchaeota archaeon]